MEFTFVPMNLSYAKDIAYDWNYNGDYSFYNMTSDEDDLKEFLDPANWEDRFYAVLGEDKDLVGFFQFSLKGEAVEIGLGLKPKLTGLEMGKGFVAAGLDYIKQAFSGVNRVILTVAVFNKRAINLYKNLGFKETETRKVHTNGAIYDFLAMEKDLN